MSPLIRIPLGLAVMVVGFMMVRKTNVVISWFGRVPFAEQKFGSGGSIFFYKLLGIATNVISGILEDLAGLLTHTKN
jgi:hypothetical protein